MAEPVKTWNLKQVQVTVAGRVLEGGGQSDFVSLELDTDSYDDMAGTHGEVVRSRQNDPRGALNFTFMQTNPNNDFMDALSAADEESGTGLFPVRIIDGPGSTSFFAAECWIRKRAGTPFNRNAGERQWIVRFGNHEYVAGGHGSSDVLNAVRGLANAAHDVLDVFGA